MPGGPHPEGARRLAAIPSDEPARRRAGRAEEVCRGRAAPDRRLRGAQGARGEDPAAIPEEPGRRGCADRAVLRGLEQAGEGRRVAEAAGTARGVAAETEPLNGTS